MRRALRFDGGILFVCRRGRNGFFAKLAVLSRQQSAIKRRLDDSRNQAGGEICGYPGWDICDVNVLVLTQGFRAEKASRDRGDGRGRKGRARTWDRTPSLQVVVMATIRSSSEGLEDEEN